MVPKEWQARWLYAMLYFVAFGAPQPEYNTRVCGHHDKADRALIRQPALTHRSMIGSEFPPYQILVKRLDLGARKKTIFGLLANQIQSPYQYAALSMTCDLGARYL